MSDMSPSEQPPVDVYFGRARPRAAAVQVPEADGAHWVLWGALIGCDFAGLAASLRGMPEVGRAAFFDSRQEPHGLDPMRWAALELKDSAMARLLREFGASPEGAAPTKAQRSSPDDKVFDPPLYSAICEKDADMVRALLELGADPNAKNDRTRCALMLSIMADSPECFDLLIGAGADPMALDEFRESALHMAASSRSEWAVVRLVELGVDPWAKNYVGFCPLDLCKLAGRPELKNLMLSLQERIALSCDVGSRPTSRRLKGL